MTEQEFEQKVRTLLQNRARQAHQAQDKVKLEKIRTAFNDFADGTYGDCKKCGAQIPTSHLLRNPLMFHCAACQLGFDKRSAKERFPVSAPA